MSLKVVKFGGSSLANATQFKKVESIIHNDKTRRYVVPSAPGKRSSSDTKITDLLYQCHSCCCTNTPYEDILKTIQKRYKEIVLDLKIDLDLQPYFQEIVENINKGTTLDYMASRGEFLNGVILSHLLNFEFIDAKDVIRFDINGQLDLSKTKELMRSRLQNVEYAVIPGFYGSMPNGDIKIFSRGGSDITGAIVSTATKATVYENWTDVSGLLVADPGIVNKPKSINKITYRELRELSYMGAKVLHEETIFPVLKVGIPINIRNTNAPEDEGTMILKDASVDLDEIPITGIAGKKDFTVISVEKNQMNAQIGYVRKLLTIFENHRVSFEHIPSGIDSISVVVDDNQLVNGTLEKLVNDINKNCCPDLLEVHPNMALVATVGHGMAYRPGIASTIFTALSNAKINIRMIDQGSSELNIIVGIENDQFEKAIQVIYDAFV
ncbi:aspartate kinase [Serpentinicella sp. ANB-PHB4]|uniref:aspartate kinase n=1 Tax=Serpentinicella sp. ANB-PHB4 TaxID=3074076 RepID=UPI0028648DD5|nr:aspartate kinase [Serpentinicella sp. ANB-PHB4]MDR5659432.1 aspartate kinase [Serpentinicella sp. ANB-PHB4]